MTRKMKSNAVCLLWESLWPLIKSYWEKTNKIKSNKLLDLTWDTGSEENNTKTLVYLVYRGEIKITQANQLGETEILLEMQFQC